MKASNVAQVRKDIDAINNGFSKLTGFLIIASGIVLVSGVASALFALDTFQKNTGIVIPAGGSIVTLLVVSIVIFGAISMFRKIYSLQVLALDAISLSSL